MPKEFSEAGTSTTQSVIPDRQDDAIADSEEENQRLGLGGDLTDAQAVQHDHQLRFWHALRQYTPQVFEWLRDEIFPSYKSLDQVLREARAQEEAQAEKLLPKIPKTRLLSRTDWYLLIDSPVQTSVEPNWRQLCELVRPWSDNEIRRLAADVRDKLRRWALEFRLGNQEPGHQSSLGGRDDARGYWVYEWSLQTLWWWLRPEKLDSLEIPQCGVSGRLLNREPPRFQFQIDERGYDPVWPVRGQRDEKSFRAKMHGLFNEALDTHIAASLGAARLQSFHTTPTKQEPEHYRWLALKRGGRMTSKALAAEVAKKPGRTITPHGVEVAMGRLVSELGLPPERRGPEGGKTKA